METATFHAERMEEALGGGEALATDAAEYLVERGVPFREAHEAVGAAAKLAGPARQAARRRSTAAEWRELHRAFAPDVLRCFDARRSLSRRELPGAPGPQGGPRRARGAGRRRWAAGAAVSRRAAALALAAALLARGAGRLRREGARPRPPEAPETAEAAPAPRLPPPRPGRRRAGRRPPRRSAAR